LPGLIELSSYQERFLSSKRTYKVAVLFTWKSTHISGADIGLSGVNIVRVADGKIAESNYYYDTRILLEQMGFKIVPPEEPEKK
jgi:hypothetical protein